MYAAVTLPPFEFKTTKIIIYGHTGGSGNVTRNIYVGDQAVSTATTSGKEDHTYEIAADYQAAGTIYRIQVGNNYNSHITKIEFYGEAEVDSDATMYNVTATVNDETMGKVTGTGEFAEGSTVVLTAEPNMGYEFVKWEDESTANPRQITVNADIAVTATFQALPVKTIAEVNALDDNTTFALNEFVVTYVNGKNTYIKDATGYAVICSDQAYGLNAGDVVAANKFMGTKVTKSGAVQYQPAVEATALAATAGAAPSPEVLATTPAKADLYKYVKLEQVVIQGVMAPVCLSSLGMLNMEWLSSLTTFTTNGIYEVVGVVTSASGTLQVNMISEKKLSLTIAASVNDKNMGKVKGAGEYLPGTEATLTAEPKEGYEFANWTAGEEVVSTEEVYTFTVADNVEFVANFQEEVVEPVYEIYEVEINDLSIDLDNLILYGSASANFDVEVMLGLGEVIDMNTGVYQLNPESYVGINGSDATFVEGTAYDIDAFAPAAKAVVRCIWNGMNIELQLNMSAAPLEATVVVVENAAVEIEKFIIFGDVYDYSLKMTGTWYNEADETTYPVLVEVPVYYPEATEPSTITSTVTVGDWVDENGPWLGFGEGDLTIETVDGVVTATGVVQNPMTGIAIDITISGTLPQGPTGVENLNGAVAPVKMIENGQIFIIRNGVKYNAQGAQL